ncbi:hypothetical protein CHS0354_037758 [Potamilus streckersoni]|uniref:Uncharacterized protein n=1 Tax=Potamilus streckersoni TaxID=2493646 RepID=A0AAE0T3N7_9BIVA|nr:hypothetical protein CHS0354_037758 [Potamilus streckersoni]
MGHDTYNSDWMGHDTYHCDWMGHDMHHCDWMGHDTCHCNWMRHYTGISAPRTLGKGGVPLPSPRLVSNVIHQSAVCNLQDNKLSAFAMQWGQNLAHDFIDTPTLQGIRNPINQATSFIDASFLYGADKETMDSLRLLKGGDNRIHVVPGLATIQIIFLREHNRIATFLGNINSHWDDETIFQETRKIVAAIVQHVVYMEYLPHILGPIIMKKYGLYSTPKGFNTVYNPTVDPTTANAFGAAAYRFGHTLIPGELILYNHLLLQKAIKIEHAFNRPTALMDDYGRGADNLCRWLFRDGAAKSDRFLEPGLRDNLFLDDDGDSFDLAAVNIQRGRDQGIPGYNAWREWCGLPVAVHFGSGPGGLVDLYPDAAMLLSKLYRNPDDIDLFTAGLSERHVLGGSVGPTFACIIGHQFKEWKQGDRFWYENMFSGSGFTLRTFCLLFIIFFILL